MKRRKKTGKNPYFFATQERGRGEGAKMAIIFTLAGFQAQFPIHNYLSPFVLNLFWRIPLRFGQSHINVQPTPSRAKSNIFKKDCFFLGNFISTDTIKDSNLLFVMASRANLNSFRIWWIINMKFENKNFNKFSNF